MLTPQKLTKRQTVQIIEQLHHKKNYYLLCSFYPHCDKVEHVKNRQRRQQLKITTLLYQGLNNLMGRQTFVFFVYFVAILTFAASFDCYTVQQHSYERNHIYPFNSLFYSPRMNCDKEHIFPLTWINLHPLLLLAVIVLVKY